MANVLFVTWDGGGNVPPALEIAAELKRRGDVVRFLGHPAQRGAIEDLGFQFEEYTRSPPWSAAAPNSGPAAPLAYAAIFTDRRMGDDLLNSLRREPADRVVIDGLLIGAMQGAARAGIHFAVLVHTLYSVMDRSLNRAPLGLVMRLRGLNPARLYRMADSIIVATLEVLDAASGKDASGRVHYTGPLLPAGSRGPERTSADPLILVSLSTTYIDGQRDTLQAILEALDGLPARAVVTTGPAVDPDELRAPENAELRRFSRHDELMQSASLVIGHGGHATTMLALAHDLPLLIMPMNRTFDQPSIGQVVAAQGAGRVLRKQSTPDQIRRLVQEMLATPSYRSSAARLGTLIRGRRGAAIAADRLTADSSRA